MSDPSVLVERDGHVLRQDSALIYKGFLKDHYVQKPIIAAVEGYCYAGGMEVMASKDAKEGPRAFLEKRPPSFTGE